MLLTRFCFLFRPTCHDNITMSVYRFEMRWLDFESMCITSQRFQQNENLFGGHQMTTTDDARRSTGYYCIKNVSFIIYIGLLWSIHPPVMIYILYYDRRPEYRKTARNGFYIAERACALSNSRVHGCRTPQSRLPHAENDRHHTRPARAYRVQLSLRCVRGDNKTISRNVYYSHMTRAWDQSKPFSVFLVDISFFWVRFINITRWF